MRLTRFSDYAVRSVLYLAANNDRLCSIGEIAKAYNISQNHLMKVVSTLVAHGYVQAQRGRNGGIRLTRPAEEVNIGKLIRHTEGKADLVGCVTCKLRKVCELPGPLDLALEAFFAVLERYTVADVLAPKGRQLLIGLLSREDGGAPIPQTLS